MIEIIEKCIKDMTGVEEKIDQNINLSAYGLDSLRRVGLVILLEEKFQLTFNDSDLTQKNFDTICSIDKLVRKYREE